MKNTARCILALAIVFSSGIAWSAPESPENFYRQAIDTKIAQCERKALFANCRGENLREYGKKACDQAAYYRNNKEQLVQEMMRLTLEQKSYKIDYFLICRYCNPKQLAAALVLPRLK